MKSKRQEVIDFIIKAISDIIPKDKENPTSLRAHLEGMSDSEFDTYMLGFNPDMVSTKSVKRSQIPYYIPNLSKHRVSTDRLFEIHDKLGYSADGQHLIMSDPNTGLKYLTPHTYTIVELPLRRQSQTIVKKNSIPVGTQAIDELSNQPTNQSKGSRISRPELASLLARQLDKTTHELINIRGGNEEARREFKRQLISGGSATLDSLRGLGQVKSLESLSVFYNCMHLGNNVLPETRVPKEAMAADE